jgi:hypothetical protein
VSALRKRVAALLVSGGLLFGNGACVPENFWATQWDYALSSVAEAVIYNTAVVAIENALALDEAAEEEE